jgi:plastocyanin
VPSTPGRISIIVLALATAVALALPSAAEATFAASEGGEPPVTNTPTDSHFFDYNPQGLSSTYCVTSYHGSQKFERGCIGPYTASGRFSQTENGLADGTLVGVYVLEYREGIPYPCSFDFCHSSTLIDLGQPVLTVYAAGTATYTNNPQVPMHIDYFDAHSHPWFAAGGTDASAVFICARRDRPCTNEDVHNYDPNCSHVNVPRLTSPGEPKGNSFDCSFNLSSEADGPVYLCASAADQSVPDPDPSANEATLNFPTHVNQFKNPATGEFWTAADANLAENACGSVILDRAPPALNLHPSTTTPAPGDLVTFSASGTDSMSGISGPFNWDFGDNTPAKQGANITHTYSDPGTYRVTLTGHDGAGNEGSASADIVVKKGQGGTGDEGTVVSKPPSRTAIGGKDGTQKASLGSLQVVAPKKHRLGKKPSPILLMLVTSQPGAFQAALSKGPKIVAKGAGTLAKAGTFGFKLVLPKRLTAGNYKLRLTFIPDGATTGSTQTIPIRFIASNKRRKARAHIAAVMTRGADAPVNIEGAPPLAPGYGR